MIVLGALAPHPPIIVPAVGRGEEAKAASTAAGLCRLAEAAAEAGPETIVVLTPHGNVFRDRVAVSGGAELSGSLARFGDRNRRTWTNDLELAREIAAAAAADGLPALLLGAEEAEAYGADLALDHGVLVPMSFLARSDGGARLVVIGMSFLPLEDLYRCGQAIAAAAETVGRKVMVLASGDLSHRLSPASPYGMDPRGREFDELLLAKLGQGDVAGVLGIDPVVAEKAGECGYRTVVMMLGALDGWEIEAKVLSYEGPFGIGYGVAAFKPVKPSRARAFGADFRERRRQALDERRRQESPLVRLARETVEAYVKQEPLPEAVALPAEARGRAGVFVSIKKGGELRGCIGTIAPTRKDVAAEIQANAIAASTQDPRFEPVQPAELPDLVYSVDILAPAESIASLAELDPRRYGVIVKRGGRRGLLLPNLEGIDTAEEQVAIAKRKAGIDAGEDVELERFEVVRYH